MHCFQYLGILCNIILARWHLEGLRGGWLGPLNIHSSSVHKSRPLVLTRAQNGDHRPNPAQASRDEHESQLPPPRRNEDLHSGTERGAAKRLRSEAEVDEAGRVRSGLSIRC